MKRDMKKSLPSVSRFLAEDSKSSFESRQTTTVLTSPKNGTDVREILVRSFEETTAHGLAPLVRRESWFIRIVWVVCTLASTAVCAYLIALVIIAYLSYDTVTSTEQVRLLTTDFPAVTICSLNPLATNESVSFVHDLFISNQLVNNSLELEYLLSNIAADKTLVFKYFAVTNALDPNRSDEFRKSLGYSMKDMLISCSYNLIDCSADDFSWFFDVLYGNCFTFNSGKFLNGSARPIDKSTKVGYVNGLTVELLMSQSVSMSGLSYLNGARVVVHNQSYLPIFYDGIMTPTGFQTSVEIRRVFSSHLPSPYSDCTDTIDSNHPSKIVQAILNSGQSYRQQLCINICLQYYVSDKCGCYDFANSISPSLYLDTTRIRPCLNFSQIKCDTIAYFEFYSMDVGSICGSQCPLECHSITYNLFTSQSEYPSEMYANSLANNHVVRARYNSDPSKLTYASIRKNMLQIAVYYSNLGYENNGETENMSLLDLISNIGGTLGLFLGVSFLSFVEIFDFFLQICFEKRQSTNVVKP